MIRRSLLEPGPLNKAVFIDRDGVINDMVYDEEEGRVISPVAARQLPGLPLRRFGRERAQEDWVQGHRHLQPAGRHETPVRLGRTREDEQEDQGEPEGGRDPLRRGVLLPPPPRSSDPEIQDRLRLQEAQTRAASAGR